MQREDSIEDKTAGDMRFSVLSPEVFHAEVLHPLISGLYPRLQRIFRYARPFSGYQAPGSGDILYTVRPDSRIAVSVLTEVDGMDPVFRYLSPEDKSGAPGMHTVEKDSILQRLVIPFTQLGCVRGLAMPCALTGRPGLPDGDSRVYRGSIFRDEPDPRPCL